MSGYTAEMTELYTAEPETEPHIVIAKDKTVVVPEELRAIATQFEKNIETVTFDCPRYWDEHDLSEMHMYINFRRADGVELPHLCEAPTVDEADENIVHFDWTVGDDVTAIKGKLSFVAVAKKADENGVLENRWASRLCQDMEILEGIEPNYAEILEPSADIIEQLLYKLDTAAAVAVDAAERAIAAAQSATVVNPNLLDNWYFADPVNQRGQTEYTAGYTIDRWMKNGGSGTIAITNNGLAFDHGGGASVGISQMIERYEKYKGRTVTLSAIMDSQLYSYTFVLGFASGGFTLGKCRAFSLDGLHILLRVYAEDAGANPVNIAAVKLELGDKQTLAHQDASGKWVLNEIPDYGEELRKCQRYMILFGAWRRVRATRIEPDVVHFDVPVSQQMRITPSFVNNSGGSLIVSAINDSASFAADTVYVDDAGAGYIRLSVSKAGHGLTDAYLANNNSDPASVYFDANL